ncbi:unnamed protein product [Ambrosiozyma monospora]|uniref:Unnamed protein product n=1 Tax=Ambrosiozyma monospora TaxID=43982 RepID=A0ACB5SX15_AMBMO|nr:unnamed protein product [Ambrosiozyma monospora]
MDRATIISNFPPEIQCLILEKVILDYLKSITDIHGMLAQLVSMLGYHHSLDDMLSVVIQDLEVGTGAGADGTSLFTDAHFDEFANFLSTRSIKLKSIKFSSAVLEDPILHEKHRQILQFIDSCCGNVVAELPTRYDEYQTYLIDELMWLRIVRNASSLAWTTIFLGMFHSQGLFVELVCLKKLTFRVTVHSDIYLLKSVLEALGERRIKNNKLSLALIYDFTHLDSDIQDHFADIIQLSNIVKNHICFDGKLKLSTVSDVRLSWKPSSNLLIDKYQDLLLAGNVFSVTILFSSDADECDFKIFQTLNQLPFLRTLVIKGSDSGYPIATPTPTPTVIISNPSIAKIELYEAPLELKFSFLNCPSNLKLLSMNTSSVSPINFESIQIHCMNGCY